MLVYSNKSLIRKEKKQKAPHVFYLCHHEKRDYSFNGFRVNKAASESKTPVSIKGALPFRLSPGSAGRPQHGMWCQQLFSAAWLALQRCTNLIRGWDELCNACRQMIVSGGWQYLILQNFIAEANEKFKKEDEKEEEIRKWNASKNKSKKKKNQQPVTADTTQHCSAALWLSHSWGAHVGVLHLPINSHQVALPILLNVKAEDTEPDFSFWSAFPEYLHSLHYFPPTNFVFNTFRRHFLQ